MIGMHAQKDDNHSKLNNQHNLGVGGGLYDHLMSTKDFHFDDK